MIRLSGSVEEADPAQWRGAWRFAKERKSHSDFAYSKLGDEVPGELRDLYLYAVGRKSYLSVVSPQLQQPDGAVESMAESGEEGRFVIANHGEIGDVAGVWEGHFKLKTKEGWKDVQELLFVMPASEVNIVAAAPSVPTTPASGASTPGPAMTPRSTPQSTHEQEEQKEVATTPTPDVPPSTPGPQASTACKVMGFGKNAFGKFSLVGDFNPITRHLNCDKKYLYPPSNKHKRGPRTPVGSLVRSQSASILEDGDGHRMVTRTRTHTSVSGTPATTPVHAEKVTKKRRLVRSRTEDGDTDNDDRTGRPPMPSPGGVKDYMTAYYDDETGEVYEGGWVDGNRHGKGICLYSDGFIYEGEWVLNREHGRGQLLTGDRQVVYNGEWCDGKMQGHGVYHFPGGDRYTGDWRESVRHGKGEYMMRSGARYDGEWKDNVRSGRGVFTWHDGSFYDGEWENDTRHGKGVLQLSTGFMYEGTWVNDNMEGKGVCVFPNGHTYRGMFKAGLRDGRGSYFFPEGAVYEGRFREDRIDGQGTVKIERPMPGVEEGDFFIPLEIQSDIRRIHYRAGFDGQGN